MNKLRHFMLSCVICISIFSCSKDGTDDSTVGYTERIQVRNASHDPFFDLMYTHDTLNLGVTRGGFYQFVDRYRSDAASKAVTSSTLDFLKQHNIYPCWYCGESEYLDFDNYYVPFYDLSNGRLDGVLVLQERDGEKFQAYLGHYMVDQIVQERTEPYSQYWFKIMNYFDGGLYGKDKKDYFSSPKPGCFESGHVQKTCVCEGSGEDCGIYIIPMDINEPARVDCMPSCFELPAPPGGPNDDGGPLETADVVNWIDKSGGGGGNDDPDPDPVDDWDDFCGSFNGSLGTASSQPTFNPDGTGNIPLIPDPEELYLTQIEAFIGENNLLPYYTAKELMELIGEECAVSYAPEVRACLKCHLINELGLTDQTNWDLFNDFQIYAECEGSPNSDCIICDLAIKDFEAAHEMDLSPEVIASIKAETTGCSGASFEDEAWAMIMLDKGIIDEEMKEHIFEHGLENEEGRMEILPIDWSTSTDNERVNHIYKALRIIYYHIVCIDNQFPEDNLSHSYSIREFFTNFGGMGDIWIANDAIELSLLDGTVVDIASFTLVLQNMTDNYDMINVLGVNVAPPVGNSSDLYSLYWPRGGTSNPNTSIIDIRAPENIINIIQDDFFIPCN